MDIIQAIFLGLLQGLTEFFPVSSSGHLVLAQSILGIDGSAGGFLFFDIMLHVGTLIALFAVFWKDLLALFKPPFKKLALLALASVPAALAGFFLSDILEGLFAGGLLLPFMFLLTAVLLAVTEFISSRRKAAAQGQGIGVKNAVIMGAAQAVAVIPGLSRSGATICAGVLSGAQREKAAKFSFFMSIPIILGSALFSLVKGGSDMLNEVSALAVVAGMLAAAVAGFFAINLMLKLISKNNYKWFAVYLAALFIVTFVNYFVKFI